MKALTKLALAIAILTTAVAAQAEWVRGYFRSNGTYVMPYYRTPANGIPCDNLSYRGYPSQQPGYISPRTFSSHSDFTWPTHQPAFPRFDVGCLQTPTRWVSFDTLDTRFDGGLQTMPKLDSPFEIRPLTPSFSFGADDE